ncbi:MAG: hypothetical protein OEW36_14380 [Hylemonella sp.]|nr:hypothetical protein [Hylemonella sp.]
MNSISDNRRRVLCAALAIPAWGWGLVQAAGEAGALQLVAPFDAATWAQLRQSGPRPAAYVFTATYCSTCPAVFEQLHAHIAAAGARVPLVAVVMDAQGERVLTHARHYQGVTQLYAFSGFAPEIRRAVDPKWRNITPYVVLLDRQGGEQRCLGAPAPAMLAAWLR